MDKNYYETKPEIILEMAKAIQLIEHSGWHTWRTCCQTARDRAIKQAEDCYMIVKDYEKTIP